MSKKLLIILANSDPTNAAELGAPLFQATVAAAMSYVVGEAMDNDTVTFTY